MQLLQNKARAVRATSASRRVVAVKAVAAPEAIKTLNTTRSDQVRFSSSAERAVFPASRSLYLAPRSGPPHGHQRASRATARSRSA